MLAIAGRDRAVLLRQVHSSNQIGATLQGHAGPPSVASRSVPRGGFSPRPETPDDLHPREVIVDPGNPYDFTQAEIDELQQAEPNAEIVSHFRDETEYGGGIAELVHIWLELRGAGLEFRHLFNQDWPSIVVVATGIRWLRKRWNKDKAKRPRPRPRQLGVYDQEARRLIQIDIDLPHGEPKVLLDETDRHHHDKPVGARKPGSRRNPARRNPNPGEDAAEGPDDDADED